MPYITRADDLSTIPLSSRTLNCMRRAKIHTVGDMLDFPKEQLAGIRNMGVKGMAEIQRLCTELLDGTGEFILVEVENNSHNAEEVCEIATAFLDDNGAIVEDALISTLPLSIRAKNGLKNGGYLKLSQLVGVSPEDLMNIRNMGAKTVREICDYVTSRQVTQANAVEKPKGSAPMQEFAEEMCLFYGQEQSVWLREVLNVEAQYPEAQGESFIYRLYDTSFVRGSLKSRIIALIEENGDEISKRTLASKLPSHLFNTTIIEEVLLELESMTALEIGDELLFRQYPSVMQYVERLSDMRDKQIVLGRLQGKTLQDIGDELGLTKERVRQVTKKALRRHPYFREDQYAYIFQNYALSPEDLFIAFDEPLETYNYLEIAYSTNQNSQKPLEEVLVDISVSPKMRKKVEKAVFKQYIMVDGIRIKMYRPTLVKHFVKNNCRDLTRYDDFVVAYQLWLESLGIGSNPALVLESRTYENKLNHCDYVLWNQWRSFRYYSLTEHDYTELLSTLNIEQYENTELSTLKFFRDYPELMKQYGIRDEYELHNLLRKIWPTENKAVTFGKMPTIEVGTANRDEQVLDLLLQYAPISAEGLATKYEETYGVKAMTVLSNYMAAFDVYFYEGVYSITSKDLVPQQFERMTSVLTDDYYPITEVKRLYLREFPQENVANINPYTLKTLGFRVYAGYSGYVIRNTYSNGFSYFSDLLTKDDIVDMRNRNSQICYIGTYERALYDLRADYEIVEFSPLQYINIRRLNSLGVEKTRFSDYCSVVASRFEKGEYFTTKSLYQDGFSHELDDLGFDDWFYSSLLIEDRGRFSYQRVGGTRIILRGKENANLGDMLTWLLEQHQKIDLYDLMDLLEDRYGIHLPKEKIIEFINGTELYYDAIMEAVYIDYDTYFEEI